MYYRLNYPGDLTQDVVIDKPLTVVQDGKVDVARDIGGRPYRVFDVEYHPATQTTAVHLTY